ncbi:MAG: hypothetical protein IJX20_00200, partial [Alphaproteobacteria bacterium]|nr:hypothetical protein [Alphaproteobacteria bacterium]
GGKYKSCTCAAGYYWNGSACVSCGSSYAYACTVSGNITGGSGTACGSRYTACTCKSPFTWSSGSCVCPSTYKYACTGTGYSSGSGTACNSKYTACTCASGYEWDGSACVSSCTPYESETDCCVGTESCSDGCGGTRKCCIYSETKYTTVGCSCVTRATTSGTMYEIYWDKTYVRTYYDCRTKEGSTGSYLSGSHSTLEECESSLASGWYQCRVGYTY